MIEWTEYGGDNGTLQIVYEVATPQKINWLFDVYHDRSSDRGRTRSTPPD